jgi:hypothetical protein
MTGERPASRPDQFQTAIAELGRKASGRFAELQKKWLGGAFPDLPVAFEPEF